MAEPATDHVGALWWTRPSFGGAHQYALALVDALERLAGTGRLRCTLLLDTGADATAGPGPALPRLPLSPPDAAGATARTHPLLTRGRALARRAAGEGTLREAWRHLQRRRHAPHPDRVQGRPAAGPWLDAHGIDWVLCSAPTHLAFEARRPFVMPVHDLQHRLQPGFPEVSAGAEWAWREYTYRNAARYATLLLVDSDVGREDLLACYGPYGLTEDRVRVLPFRPAPYLDLEPGAAARARVRTHYGLPPRYLFYPAQFWPHKNHVRLVEALGQLRGRAEAVNLVLCGSHEGALRERVLGEVMMAASRAGVASQVHLLGYVPDDAMSALYAEADGVVMPTFFGPTNIPVVEAWAFGKPVLTSDIRGIREQAGDAALLVDPTSVESIARGVHRLWTDAALAARLVELGRRRLAGHAPEDFLARVGDVVREAGERVRTGATPLAPRG